MSYLLNTHLQNVIASQSALSSGDEGAWIIAEATSIRQHRTAERDAVEIVEHEQIERISLIVDEVRPIVPETR